MLARLPQRSIPRPFLPTACISGSLAGLCSESFCSPFCRGKAPHSSHETGGRSNLFPERESGNKVVVRHVTYVGPDHLWTLRETGRDVCFGKDAVDTKIRYFELTI